MLLCHARCVLSRLCCNGHSLPLGSYLFRIGGIEILPAAPVDTRPRTPLISFCTVQLWTLCSAHSLATLCLFSGLCWSRQHQQVSHFSSLFLQSDSRSVLAILSSSPSFLLPQTLWQIRQELSSLSSCFIRLQWVPGHSFLPGNDAVDELVRRGALLAPSAILCSLSPLIFRIQSCLFSCKFFDTQVLSISTEELVLLRHARCVLSRLRCNGHSLLLSSCFFRIGRIENPVTVRDLLFLGLCDN